MTTPFHNQTTSLACMSTNVPGVMYGVQLVSHGGPEMLVHRRDLSVDEPGHDEVLIRVAAAGVNNTDLNTRSGWYASADGDDGGWAGAIASPRIQGADVCGHVVAVGVDVQAALLGRRVIVQGCLRSRALDGVAPWLGSEVDGAFAQYVRAPAADTYPVGGPRTDVELAAVPCAYGTAENLLTRAGAMAGERVLVTGASGGVGLAAAQLATLRGCEVVAVVAAAKAPAFLGIVPGASTVDRDAVSSAVAPQSVDVVIDLVGGPTWPALLERLRPRGRYAASGAIAGPLVELDLRTLYLRDIVLHGATTQDAGVFERVVAYLEKGLLVPPVSAVYPMEEIAQAQEVFAGKAHLGKIVLVPPPA